VRRTFSEHRVFGWQNGYGAFTVDSHGIGQVRWYIANQQEHHRTRNFQDELDALWRAFVTAEDAE
jgi:hypothetical protein